MNRGRGRGSNGPKVMKSNHVIQCIQYTNVGLFKGDTYTYRGLFRRNGGEYNREFYGYVVDKDSIDKIKSELTPMLSGFIIHKRDEELPVEAPKKSFIEEDSQDVKTARVQFIDEDNYENDTSSSLTI